MTGLIMYYAIGRFIVIPTDNGSFYIPVLGWDHLEEPITEDDYPFFIVEE
jgi:hypothetical protein